MTPKRYKKDELMNWIDIDKELPEYGKEVLFAVQYRGIVDTQYESGHRISTGEYGERYSFIPKRQDFIVKSWITFEELKRDL